ncbi:MAG: NTP transferase domain-containing protein [Spirochaetaceae bacterium]
MVNVHTYTPTTIVPAAGLSKRFSRWKLNLPYCGESLLRRALHLAREVSDEVILVVGHRRDEAEAIARSVAGVTLVYNPWYLCGLFSSLLSAIPRVRGDGAYVLLPDMPLLRPEHFRLVQLRARSDVLRPTYDGRPGHPVYLAPRVLTRALSFPLRGSMPDVLKLYDVLDVPTNDIAVVTDVDSELDYRRLISHSSSP